MKNIEDADLKIGQPTTEKVLVADTRNLMKKGPAEKRGSGVWEDVNRRIGSIQQASAIDF